MFHLGQKRISCIQLGQQLLDVTCGTSGWRENAERKKYWLVNYWKVQREPMGKVAKELKNNVGWGNRDMPENLVVGLETSTMLESHRGLKNYKHQENHWTQKGAMKSKDRRELITKDEPKKSLVMYFKEVVTRLSFQRSWGTWTFLLPYFFVLRIAIKAQAAFNMLKNRASRVWQDKSFKKWGGSQWMSVKKWFSLQNGNVESTIWCLW